MQNPGLNLARAWRPKRFDELVGQDLVVRLLQNSLYRSYFFPVYLFAGQRGCGKTTSARIFAAAINCQAYGQFVKEPQKTPLPCLTCDGCQMMAHGKHPDVIEIDAASHTGVDHVRQVIDAASFVPVYGQKRIYIIDEAHMLSKAAFNALLKMLEEPPLSVLFMLATTDANKIPDTIKSRCFHLFFSPLEPTVIAKYVSRICTAESIPFDDAGLHLIARQAEGSARDAVNMIERVRLAHEGVTIDAVRQVLGCLDDASCIQLFESLFTGDAQQVLSLFIELEIEKFTPRVLLARLIEYLHGVMWVLHGVDASASRTTGRFTQVLRPRGTRALVLEMLSVCYAYEAALARSSNGHQVFQMVCLTLCQLARGDTPSGQSAGASISTRPDGGPTADASVVKSKGAVAGDKLKSTAMGKVGVNIPTGKAAQLGNAIAGSGRAGEVPGESGMTKEERSKHVSGSNEATAGGTTDELNKRVHGASDGVLASGNTIQQIDQNGQEKAQGERESDAVADVMGDTPKNTGVPSGAGSVWEMLVEQVEKLNDPLVYSIFKQAVRHEFNKDEKKLHLHFPRQLSFFSEWLENTQSSWQPLIERSFGDDVVVELHFDEGQIKQPEVNRALVAPPAPSGKQAGGAASPYSALVPGATGNRGTVVADKQNKRESGYASAQQSSSRGSQKQNGLRTRGVQSGVQATVLRGGTRFNLRDKETWPKTHELLGVFPGVVSINYQRDES